MRALVWCGKGKVQVERVPDPKILAPHDVILQITSTAICGSDLHLYDGYIPAMQPGDILGHEFMGRIVDIGSEVHNLRIGDRVVIPFAIACGGCFFCKRQLYAACDNTNPNAWMVENLYGHSCAGMFGYSHAFGGYAGGQAEFVRVPMADVGALKVPEELPDEQVLFLSDIFPTGYQAADQCDLKGGETVAVWGAGPVGLMALKSAKLLGAAQLISIDRVPERLAMAQRQTGAIPLKFDDADIYERLMDLTGGRGPDACIDAVGMEAHGASFDALYDRAKVALYLATDRAHVLRQMIRCCRKAGVLSLPGVYGGAIDKFPLGAAFGKGLTFRMGQTHVQRYMRPLLERIIRKEIDPSDIITHRMNLSQAAEAYEIFHQKRDHCIKVVLNPSA